MCATTPSNWPLVGVTAHASDQTVTIDIPRDTSTASYVAPAGAPIPARLAHNRKERRAIKARARRR